MVQVVYDKPAYWFVFCKDELLLQRETEGRCTVPYGAEPPVKLAEWNIVHRLTPLEGRECRAVSIDMPVVGDERYVMTGLRASYDVLPRELYLKAGKGAEILYWDKNTKFCGVCGAPMKLHTDISKRCTNCGKEVWPQLATEETGVRVENIRYFGSQPWPYPCGLMIGFYADYVEGDLHLQRSEIAYGGWFNRDKLPDIPGKVSMARMLIDAWLEGRLAEGCGR